MISIQIKRRRTPVKSIKKMDNYLNIQIIINIILIISIIKMEDMVLFINIKWKTLILEDLAKRKIHLNYLIYLKDIMEMAQILKISLIIKISLNIIKENKINNYILF